MLVLFISACIREGEKERVGMGEGQLETGESTGKAERRGGERAVGAFKVKHSACDLIDTARGGMLDYSTCTCSLFPGDWFKHGLCVCCIIVFS